MQHIRFTVVRDGRFRSVDGLNIHSDGGTGVMDWAHPVTPRRLLFWEDAGPMPPHLLAGHLMARHLDSVRFEGHLTGTHLLDCQGHPAGTTVFEVGPFVFGRFRHAVVTEDELGNRRLDGVIVRESVINSDPPPPSHFRAEEFDPATGILAFSFTPSEKLVG